MEHDQQCNEKAKTLESITAPNHLIRYQTLCDWLVNHCQLSLESVHAMRADASSRRYFRVETPTQTYVVMDAPPHEKCDAFIAIANALRKMGITTPEILAADLNVGFLLLSDLGKTTYLQGLTPQNADQLYAKALQALTQMQLCQQVESYVLPPFTGDFMLKEWEWHKEWFSTKLLQIKLHDEKALDQVMREVVQLAVSQPQVFMHRDYHSANLMVLPKGEVGVLDFQDAFMGPITYDLVSLLRDCYIAWPEEKVQQWLKAYLSLQTCDFMFSEEEFIRWFDWMGVQRHLKALMTFARKALRDEQPSYLPFIPRTLNYLHVISSRYKMLAPIFSYIDQEVMPAFARLPCVQ